MTLSLDDGAREEEGSGLDPAGGEEPREILDRRERRQRIARAIGELAPEHREVVVLRDVEEHSYEEIAQMLEVPVGTVRSRLHRARHELKHRLKDVFGTDGA